MVEIKPETGIALYVHWPWCVRKCPYCDFNSAALSNRNHEKEYLSALLIDLEVNLQLAGPRTVTSIFFGGGTPSLMSPDGFAGLMEGIRSRVRLASDCEVTMEANPGTVEHGRFEDYAQAGINRFSIGVQSFDDRFLKALGRIHTGQEAHRAVEAALHCTDNVNLDVMYALPGQRLEDVRRDVDAALCSGVVHLSFYELTIEEGTAFAKRPPAGLPDIDAAADMGELVHAALCEAGFEHYEISGYARAGRRCRHNLTYWTFGDYLGIGAGAHGKVTEPNEASDKLHLSMGFRRVGFMDNVGFKLGKWRDVGHYEKLMGDFDSAPEPVIPITELDPAKVEKVLKDGTVE